jgi:branched-chain amino acid transport system substrate-binding protein
VTAYTAAYRQRSENWAAMGYALARLAVTAIKNAGPHPDREKVNDVMNALHDQPTIIGNHNWTMDARRNPH